MRQYQMSATAITLSGSHVARLPVCCHAMGSGSATRYAVTPHVMAAASSASVRGSVLVMLALAATSAAVPIRSTSSAAPTT